MDGGYAMGGPRHVLIVGGGASGVLMSVHLLRSSPGAVRVTLIEKDTRLGCGIAYGTGDPDHLLNSRVGQMSAFPDDPAHFARWLGPDTDGNGFVDRATYGRYLGALLDPHRTGAFLDCIKEECLTLEESPGGVTATLADGRVVQADHAILATGHAVPATPEPPLRGAWDFTPPEDKHAVLAIVGTGLSMVDHVATLLANGHVGPIHAISRRGLMPQGHMPSRPLQIAPGDVPIGASVAGTMGWLRGLVRQAVAEGGTWRDAVDGIRPQIPAIWGAWPLAERARFLRHAAAFWEVHRHRMPPISARRIAGAQESGQLTIHRAGFDAATLRPDGRIALRLSPRGTCGHRRLVVDRVLDCRGIRRDPAAHAVPVVRELIGRGRARLDPLKLGLDTTTCARLIAADGRPSRRLHAIGPAARGAIWEITAIPDIREQTVSIARHLTREAGVATAGAN